MKARFTDWVRKQPLVAFYVFAFALTWLGWVPQALHSRGLFPFDSFIFYLFGGVGPLLAVFIVRSILRGRSDFDEPFRPYLLWRFSGFWYAVALLGYPAMWIATILLSGDLAAEMASLAPPLSLLYTFLLSFVAAIPEEVAWRGFALPRLQARYSALASSLIVGVLWFLWHLPLLWNVDNAMSGYAVLPFFLDVLLHSILYVWIFNSTRGSLLFVTLFHAASNTVGLFVGWENVAVTLAIAAALVVVFGPANLSREERQKG